MQDVKLITVGEADDGQRLDRWLKKCVPELPYPLAQKLIRKGAIRIDGKRGRTDTRLVTGQAVRIPPLEEKVAPKKKIYQLTPEDSGQIKSMVIYDDGDVIAINKPWGLASQGGGGVDRHVDGMLAALENRKGLRPRLIHRLDRDTSGVLLCARSAQAVSALGKSFMGRRAQKTYWALLCPAPSQPEGTIEAALIKAGGPIKDKMVIDPEFGKHAITDFIVLEQAGKQAAFVAFQPRTGRTHQLRVHASEALGCPIIGDGKYGADKVVTGDAETDLAGLKLADRLHLHARRLVIEHPKTGEKLVLEAPLPPELRKSWKQLGFNPSYKGDPFDSGA